MEFEALAKGCENGCPHVAVASQTIVGYNAALFALGTGRVLAANSQCGERIDATA